MTDENQTAYRRRFERVLEYIEQQLSEELSVDRIAEVACFSKHHFHRQFSIYVGINIAEYVRLLRLRRAGYQLAFRGDQRIVDIAVANGFDSAESFCRAFKRVFGQAPSRFRVKPDWTPWLDRFHHIKQKREISMTQRTGRQVEITDFKETKVAVLEHRGAPERVMESVRNFIRWRKQFGHSPRISETYNIVYDDPVLTPPSDYRFDICASTKTDVANNDYGVVTKTIPGGRCALLRHIGTDRTIDESVNYLYADWLPKSGEELRDFPCFFHRVTLFQDVPEHDMITDIYLPLRIC